MFTIFPLATCHIGRGLCCQTLRNLDYNFCRAAISQTTAFSAESLDFILFRAFVLYLPFIVIRLTSSSSSSSTSSSSSSSSYYFSLAKFVKKTLMIILYSLIFCTPWFVVIPDRSPPLCPTPHRISGRRDGSTTFRGRRHYNWAGGRWSLATHEHWGTEMRTIAPVVKAQTQLGNLLPIGFY